MDQGKKVRLHSLVSHFWTLSLWVEQWVIQLWYQEGLDQQLHGGGMEVYYTFLYVHTSKRRKRAVVTAMATNRSGQGFFASNFFLGYLIGLESMSQISNRGPRRSSVCSS